MDPLILARFQFASTTVYHFFFVPLTLGLSVLVAVMETLYVATGQEVYKRMTRFWGKLFLINFAMGVVTGIVQEFQFGMNWSEYSRFVGDVIGAPLAIEILLAFFIESIFLGVWIFGWDKLSKGMHAAAIWLVAIASTLSAYWILVANSFMQEPVGYAVLPDGGLVMTNFFTLLTNPHVWHQFPHVVLAGFTTAAFFVMGISAYHLVRKNEPDFFQRSFKMAAIVGVAATIGVGLVGHAQGQYLVEVQPMKIAASEGLWDSEDPAAFSVLIIPDMTNRRNTLDIRIPGMLSFIMYNKFTGEVTGINEMQTKYETTHGPGNYIPPVPILFLALRIMVGIGFLIIFMTLYALIFMVIKKRYDQRAIILKAFTLAIALPYIANTGGWMLTEVGRFPWTVYGLIKLDESVSPVVSAGMLLTSLIGYVVVYGLLIVATVYLLGKYARAGPAAADISGDLQPEEEG
ncbi:MAG: cytochrome ubiquinol oxidase subunit I [Chloroflexota bacterium]|nr:cytochrome ubiquinol oxidase subunit I [Chloroflexota bacterium]